jgi:hypothetical protein
MPAGNWDFHQTLNPVTGRVEWPTGPLQLAATGTEIPTWVEAWVMHRTDNVLPISWLLDHGGGLGASQRTRQSGGWVPGYWTAAGIPPGWVQGKFQAGPALGIALAASHDNATNTDAFFWWLDVIDVS